MPRRRKPTAKRRARRVNSNMSPEPPESAKSVYDSVPLQLGDTMCIRVIKIRPSTTSHFTDVIACDFCTLDVDDGKVMVEHSERHTYVEEPSRPLRSVYDPLKYQALSYTWGTPPADRVIQLNDTPFKIRKNLWDFLQQARRHAFTQYLWIDAICIDQGNMNERNHQVGIMGLIYSRADCVIVWLGKIRTSQERVLNKRLVAFDKHDHNISRIHFWDYDDITDFCSLPYWSRAWIVQEYYLARRKIIWIGKLQIESDRIEHMVWLWHDRTFKSTSAGNLLQTKKWAMNPCDTAVFSTLVVLLELFGELECADPRDRFYALLPLLDPRRREELGITPDYSVPATQLFLDLFSSLTKQGAVTQSWSTPSKTFLRLYRMLQPDLRHRAIQLAILDLRAAVVGEISEIKLAFHHNHEPDDDPHAYPISMVQVCQSCRKGPMIWCEPLPRLISIATPALATARLKAWVSALVDSDDHLDRELSTKIRNDRYFRNWKWDIELDDNS